MILLQMEILHNLGDNSSVSTSSHISQAPSPNWYVKNKRCERKGEGGQTVPNIPMCEFNTIP